MSMPIGSGKSLCSILLPKVFDNLRGGTSIEIHAAVIVVSPLVAIMKDEVRQMSETNRRADSTPKWMLV